MRRLLLCLPLMLVVGCPSKDDAAPPKECNGATAAQALTAAKVYGASIATAKTLALSFDDGPASRTGELSTFLKNNGIRATFFVNHRDDQLPAWFNVLPQLVADGHVIGNHTKTHADLTVLAAQNKNAEIVAELTDVDTMISPFVPNNRYLFRAPYGFWNQAVYDALKGSPMNKYLGHVEWEIGDDYIPPTDAADVACWQQHNQTSKQCGDLYIADITDKGGKGIVLMHDADYGNTNNTDINVGIGNTIDMVKYIVPLLKADGYQFIGVDQVPDIAAVLPPLPPADAGPEGGEGGTSTSSSGGASSSSSSSSGSSSSGGSSGATSSSGSNPCP